MWAWEIARYLFRVVTTGQCEDFDDGRFDGEGHGGLDMNYSDLADAELDRLVAEKLEPDPPVANLCPPVESCVTSLSPLKGWCVFLDGEPFETHELTPRAFTSDPAAWGWLLEREKMDLFHAFDGWSSTMEGGGASKVHPFPGRAVAIAYLEAGLNKHEAEHYRPTYEQIKAQSRLE